MRTKAPAPHLISILAPLFLAAAVLTGCSNEPDQITLGGTRASASPQRTVERPWGTVKTFPDMQKAESPGAADVTFAAEMIMHHRQAIELGQNVRGHDGLDERVDASARFIVQDQKNEITTMKAWLQAWNQPDGAEDHDHDATTMPGMLPQSQVDQIATLDGPEAQIAFLLAMIEHHEGAITMSQDYLTTQQNAFTRSTATHIISEQGIEIDYMNRLVDELCAADGPATCPAD